MEHFNFKLLYFLELFMSNITLRNSIALVLGMYAAPMAFAHDHQPHVVLDDMVITATRVPTNQNHVAARTTVINKQTIEQNPVSNLSDVIQKDASISVKQYGGVGQVPEVSLRGTKNIHTLFLSDGARLNNQNNLSPVFSGFYDLTNIDKVEILKGPASVQYGSDAIGGVVQMISKAPEKTGVNVTGLWGENNTYKASVHGNLVSDNGFYASLGGQRLESDGTRIFDNQNKHDKASYDQKGYHAKIGTNQQRFSASAAISQNEGVNIYSGTTNGALPNAAQRQFENRLINVLGSYDVLNNLTVSARYSNIKDEQTPVDGYNNHYNTQSDEGDVNARWSFAPNQNILFGVSHNKAEYDSNTITNNKQKVTSTGYYIQHQYNTDKINTQAGLRLEDNSRFGTHTVGQIAGRYHVTPSTSVYSNIGTAFRAPSLNELYTSWGGNDKLKPEESLSYEIGLDQKIGNYAKAGLSAYHTKVDKLIENPNWAGYKNIDKATFQGGEATLSWKKDAFFVAASYAHVKTKNKTTGLELSYRPKNTGTLTVGYDDGVYGLSVSAIARSKAKHYSSSGTLLSDIPNYTTVDLNAHWQATPNIKLFTNIQNVGNKTQKLVYNTYPAVNWYINDGHQANVGVTFSY